MPITLVASLKSVYEKKNLTSQDSHNNLNFGLKMAKSSKCPMSEHRDIIVNRNNNS